MKENIRENIRDLAFITLGTFIYVVGINYFIATAGIFSSGLMGLAQEATQTVNLIFNYGWETTSKTYLFVQTIFYWLMNLPAIFLGYSRVGRKFTTKTLICSFVLVPIGLNTLIPNGSLLLDVNGELTLASQILSASVGGALTGLGMGIIFRYGASSGGTDILATYLALFKGKSFGKYNLFINIIVMIWSILLYGEIKAAVLLLILIFVQSQTVDYIYNFHDKVTLFVVTTKEDEIREKFKKFPKNRRTYTKINAVQGYTRTDAEMLFLVINKEEEQAVVKFLKEIDDNCFIDSIKTKDVSGNFVNKFQTRL